MAAEEETASKPSDTAKPTEAPKQVVMENMAVEKKEEEAVAQKPSGGLNLPWWLDPNTRGGAVVVTTVPVIIPLLVYAYLTSVQGMEGTKAGSYVGFGFVVVSLIGWASTYIFRVGTKDMTYAQQLKDYENAVLAKRLEELKEDEVVALMEEIERES
eukprot:CAMPEP_0113935400 /NCGR_PEP_ID=MMETSP1339-20121228/2556_1 /TAXON_ID=94617 /ORGANISM="Fibrocapsa japonica" /LENGTH=156 /DNA_ID=CAMNT_0000937545 /DNA_START=249 /DNA_END=719 /DNA_ORIENTATION=+ /assembly_acc=CAM_ASM_000762